MIIHYTHIWSYDYVSIAYAWKVSMKVSMHTWRSTGPEAWLHSTAYQTCPYMGISHGNMAIYGYNA